jgi:hypothetical protein
VTGNGGAAVAHGKKKIRVVIAIDCQRFEMKVQTRIAHGTFEFFTTTNDARMVRMLKRIDCFESIPYSD